MSVRPVAVQRGRAGARSSVLGAWTGALASVGVHGLAIATLGAVRVPPAVPPASPVVVQVVDVPLLAERNTSTQPASPEPVVTPSPEVVRPAPSHVVQTASPPQRTVPAAAADEPAPTEEPLTLTGTTLTNDEGSWSSRVGDGRAMTGPIRAGRAAGGRAAAPATTVAEARPRAAFASATSLSRRPSAPNLDAVLARNVPSAARARGVGGDAVVTVRIAASGAVVGVTIVSESYPGFGAACRQTVLGSRWTPPLGEDGRAVGTEVRYRCRFRADR